jgi:hypothetical protein
MGRGGKRRAIRDALHRLGLHARPAQVVAALAGRGVVVSAGQVRAVLFELLRGPAGPGRRDAARPPAPPPARRFRTPPPRRGCR